MDAHPQENLDPDVPGLASFWRYVGTISIKILVCVDVHPQKILIQTFLSWHHFGDMLGDHLDQDCLMCVCGCPLTKNRDPDVLGLASFQRHVGIILIRMLKIGFQVGQNGLVNGSVMSHL